MTAAETQEKVTFEALLELSGRLKTVVDEETEALSRMKIDKVREIEPVKLALTRDLENMKQRVKKDSAFSSSLSGEQLRQIREISENFEQSLKNNGRELEKAREVNRRVVKAISDAVIEELALRNGYDKTGAQGAGGMKIAKDIPAIRINETI